MDYYRKHSDVILKEFGTDKDKGLSNDECDIRLKKYGYNEIKHTNKRFAINIFLDQIVNLLAIILIIASIISAYLGEYRDMIILLIIVFLNASIGFYQEYKADGILKSLQNMVVKKTRVLRDSKEIEINVKDLVIGDILVLDEGDGIPADIRLIETDNFFTNDFILTGESLPKHRDANAIFDKTINIPDRINCAFMGTTVSSGFAKGIVYAIGMNSEIGSIAKTSDNIIASTSPIQLEIDNIAKKMTIVALVVMVIVFISKWAIDDSIRSALIMAIGVAASMVPEGLPSQISVALALGASRLASKKAIVKKMSAVETLGSATVIASDKTGTITKNEMTITHCFFNGMHFTISGSGYEPKGEIYDNQGKHYHKENIGELGLFFLDGYLSSTGSVSPPDKYHNTWYAIGDPTEASFATLALKAGFDLQNISALYSKEKVFGFDSIRKRMSILRRHKEKDIAFIKGSLESVLNISKYIIENGKIRLMTDEDRKLLLSIANVYSIRALRVLALGYKDLHNIDKDNEGISINSIWLRIQDLFSMFSIDKNNNINNDDNNDKKIEYDINDIEKNIVFSGFVAMKDPPHDEVRYAVSSAFDAKIKLMMITGDNDKIASSIASDIGMVNVDGYTPDVITDDKLQNMSDDDIIEKFRSGRVMLFSRMSPSDKLRIINLMKDIGEVVAVTGDGVNDTLALKTAHIGVAMGLTGSQVAKEASDIVLLDDNFATIVEATKEGRLIYHNLNKTTLACITSNFGELFCLVPGFIGLLCGLPLPIQAVQILAIDLVGEMLPLTCLTFDPPNRSLMTSPPRDPKYHMINLNSLVEMMFFGIFMGLAGYISFLIMWNITGDLAKSQTSAYLGILLSQFMNILSRRTDSTIFTNYLFSNTKLWLSFLISFIFISCIVYLPMINDFLYTAPLTIQEWIIPIIMSLIFLSIHEVKKIVANYKIFSIKEKSL